MSKQKKLLGVSDLNLNIKPYQEGIKQEQPKQEGDGWDWFFKPVITGDATIEALKQPGALFNKGASQLSDNPLAGLLNIGQGIAGIPFLLATVPLAMGEDFLKTGDKLVGTTDKEGKPSGVGNFISEGINGVFETPAFLYNMGKKTVDLGLTASGIDPNKVDAKIKQGMIATRLMPKDATEQDFKDTQEALDEAGKLGLTLLAFEGVKLAKNKLAPEVKDIKVIPKTEVPQDVKQTLQIEAPKGETFSQINVDPTGRTTTIPKTKTTQDYTKLELLRDEMNVKKEAMVNQVEVLKKKAFDKELTSEQRIDAKNKLKEVKKELDLISQRLPLINKELQNKKFEVESKPIPEQKLLTEGVKEPIPTKNVPSNIDFSLPKEKKIEIGKENEPLLGLPVEKGKNVTQESQLGNVAELQKPTEIIERRTDKAGKEYYFNNETKKRTSKTEFEKQKVEDVKISEIKQEPIENKTVENIQKAQEIVGKEKFKEVATELSKDKETVLKQVYTEELANKIVEEGKLPEKYIEKVKTETKVEGKIEDAVKPQESTIDRLKREALDEYKKNASQTNIGFNPLDYKANIKLGAYHLKNGVVKFADWSTQMVKDLGEKIKPQLLRIWNEIKNFGSDLGKIALEKIGDFVESKYNPARPLKAVDLNLLKKEFGGKDPVVKDVSKEVKTESLGGLFKDVTNKDFETISKEYETTIKNNESFVDRSVESSKKIFDDTKQGIKNTFESISTSAEKIAPELFQKLRSFEQEKGFRDLVSKNKLTPYLDAQKKAKFTLQEQAQFEAALDNPKFFDKAKEIAKQKGFLKELEDFLKHKDSLAEQLGVKMIENHFPRMVKDYVGLREELFKRFPEYKPVLEKMISDWESKNGKKTLEQQMDYLNNALRGYNPKIAGIPLSDLGNMKKRMIPVLDGELKKYYHSSNVSASRYVTEMNRLISEKKFFGKGGFDIEESIATLAKDLENTGKIKGQDASELKNILRARFNERGITNGTLRMLRDIGIVTKLHNPLAALTQIKDLAFSFALSPTNTMKVLKDKLFQQEMGFKLEEIGYDPQGMSHELASVSNRQKFIESGLKVNQFFALDFIGKEVRINTVLKKFQDWAGKDINNPEFQRRLDRYFSGKEKAKVINDLKLKNKSDSVGFLLFNELSNMQPITLSELPKNYIAGGNNRIYYFLKTFSIRQLDFVLNETVRVVKNKNLPKEQRIEGLKNFMKLSTSIVLLGAGVDEAKKQLVDLITGRKSKVSFSDEVINNIINVALLSRYDFTSFKQEGGESIAKQIAPPLDFPADEVLDTYNLIAGKNKTIKSIKQIPTIGNLLYNYLKDSKNSRQSRNTRR